MRIADLIHGLDVRIVNPTDDLTNLRICDITEDSRTVMPGSLFIARKGEKVDGKQFIAGAIAAGAVGILTDDPGFGLPQSVEGRPHAERGGTQVALLAADNLNLAIARLAERFYGDPSSHMRVIGVTGTNGKTTTTFLIHQMLNALGIRCGLIGTVVIDDGAEVAPASLTTPPALEVSRTFARMHDAGCQAAVMEVSSHALHQRRVGAVNWNAAVFTNLTGDHLDYHKTMEEYAAAKAMLFEALPSDGVAIVNIQDAGHSRMVKGMQPGVRVVRCKVDDFTVQNSIKGGTGSLLPVGQPVAHAGQQPSTTLNLPIGGGTAPETVCRARVTGATTEGTDVEFTGPWGRRVCRVPLVGAFNVMNALQAVATVHALWGGTDEDALSFEIIAGVLEKASAPPGRLEPVTAIGAPIQVFVDYAHSDDALATVLGVLRGAMGRGGTSGGGQRESDLGRGTSAIGTGPMPDGKRESNSELWCVFGCGGDRDKTKRPRMGKVAAEMAGRIVVTSDNPRTEDPDTIIREILAGMGTHAPEHYLAQSGKVVAREVARDVAEWVLVEPDRERAIRAAIAAAKPGDTIIIAGKGHEDYQILPDPAKKGATITRHFDDREVARAALRERGIAVREPSPTRNDDDRDDGEDMTAGASLALGG